MKSRFATSLLSASALACIATPAFAQQTPQSAEETEDNGEIIVTATLQKESLQKVPLAVSAYNAETLEKSGVSDAYNLQQVTPTFSLATGVGASNGTTLRIRGIGTAGINSGLESSVGIFVDGVYLSRPGVIMGDLLDVEQIEVLRGPQGTLFGRNTTAGLLNVKTKKPEMDGVHGFANATYGNYDLFVLQGGITAPVSDTVGFGVSGSYRKRDGWLKHAAGFKSNDRDRFVLRGQLNFSPSDDLNIRLIADYSKYNEHCCSPIILAESSYVAAGLYAAGGLPADGGVPAGFSGEGALKGQRTADGLRPEDKAKQWGLSGTITYKMGGAELTSITSYRNFDSSQEFGPGFVGLNLFSIGDIRNPGVPPQRIFIKTFSQELRLAGTAMDDKLNWLVGAYYGDEKLGEDVTQVLGSDFQRYYSVNLMSLGAPPNILNIISGGVSATGSRTSEQFRKKSTTWSIFTNETLELADTLKFNVGLRYGNDTSTTVYKNIFTNAPACLATLANATGSGPFAGTPLAGPAIGLNCILPPSNTGIPGFPANGSGRVKDNTLSYTGKLLWSPTPQLNTYASYSRGYKGGGQNLNNGGFNLGGPGPNFKNERTDAYELGVKFRSSDGKFQLNAAAYQMDLKDFQAFQFTGTVFAIFNVPKVKSSGVELEGSFRAAKDLSFNAGLAYADTRYPKDCAGNLVAPAAVITDRCGFPLTNAPKWTVTGGFDWSHELSSNLQLGFNANAKYSSTQSVADTYAQHVFPGTGTLTIPGGGTLNAVPFRSAVRPGFAKVNLRASIGHPDGKWALEFWADNVTNKHTVAFAFTPPVRGISALPGPLNAGGIGAATAAFPEEPRTFGATLRTKF